MIYLLVILTGIWLGLFAQLCLTHDSKFPVKHCWPLEYVFWFIAGGWFIEMLHYLIRA